MIPVVVAPRLARWRGGARALHDGCFASVLRGWGLTLAELALHLRLSTEGTRRLLMTHGRHFDRWPTRHVCGGAR